MEVLLSYYHTCYHISEQFSHQLFQQNMPGSFGEINISPNISLQIYSTGHVTKNLLVPSSCVNDSLAFVPVFQDA